MPYVRDGFGFFGEAAASTSSGTKTASLARGAKVKVTVPTGATVTAVTATGTYYNGPSDANHSWSGTIPRKAGATTVRTWDQSGTTVTINSDLAGTATVRYSLPAVAKPVLIAAPAPTTVQSPTPTGVPPPAAPSVSAIPATTTQVTVTSVAPPEVVSAPAVPSPRRETLPSGATMLFTPNANGSWSALGNTYPTFDTAYAAALQYDEIRTRDAIAKAQYDADAAIWDRPTGVGVDFWEVTTTDTYYNGPYDTNATRPATIYLPRLTRRELIKMRPPPASYPIPNPTGDEPLDAFLPEPNWTRVRGGLSESEPEEARWRGKWDWLVWRHWIQWGTGDKPMTVPPLKEGVQQVGTTRPVLFELPRGARSAQLPESNPISPLTPSWQLLSPLEMAYFYADNSHSKTWAEEYQWVPAVVMSLAGGIAAIAAAPAAAAAAGASGAAAGTTAIATTTPTLATMAGYGSMVGGLGAGLGGAAAVIPASIAGLAGAGAGAVASVASAIPATTAPSLATMAGSGSMVGGFGAGIGGMAAVVPESLTAIGAGVTGAASAAGAAGLSSSALAAMPATTASIVQTTTPTLESMAGQGSMVGGFGSGIGGTSAVVPASLTEIGAGVTGAASAAGAAGLPTATAIEVGAATGGGLSSSTLLGGGGLTSAIGVGTKLITALKGGADGGGSAPVATATPVGSTDPFGAGAGGSNLLLTLGAAAAGYATAGPIGALVGGALGMLLKF